MAKTIKPAKEEQQYGAQKPGGRPTKDTGSKQPKPKK
jgi:hypothetical protein